MGISKCMFFVLDGWMSNGLTRDVHASTAFVRSGREWHNIGDSKCTQVDPRVVESVSDKCKLLHLRA